MSTTLHFDAGGDTPACGIMSRRRHRPCSAETTRSADRVECGSCLRSPLMSEYRAIMAARRALHEAEVAARNEAARLRIEAGKAAYHARCKAGL